MFCREAVADLRQVAANNPDYPKVLFVYMGSVEAGQAFFAERWPEAHAIADPRRRLYRPFGLGRGGLLELAGPGVALAGIRALAKGHLQGAPEGGDPRQMPGAFLVQGDQVLWRHDFDHAGDQPDWEKIPEEVNVKI